MRTSSRLMLARTRGRQVDLSQSTHLAPNDRGTLGTPNLPAAVAARRKNEVLPGQYLRNGGKRGLSSLMLTGNMLKLAVVAATWATLSSQGCWGEESSLNSPPAGASSRASQGPAARHSPTPVRKDQMDAADALHHAIAARDFATLRQMMGRRSRRECRLHRGFPVPLAGNASKHGRRAAVSGRGAPSSSIRS